MSYTAIKLRYSVSAARKSHTRGEIEDTESPGTIWRSLRHGYMTFLHWTNEKEMAVILGNHGGTLLVRKIPSADARSVCVGDLVVLKDPGNRDNYLVRRVVAATEGDEMVSTDKTDNPFFIDKDQCWEVYDSRTFGPVTMNSIVGLAIYLVKTGEEYHSCEYNSIDSMEEDSAIIEVELDVNEMATHHKE